MTVKDLIKKLKECEDMNAKINICIISKTDVFNVELDPENVDIDYDYSDDDRIEYSLEIHSNNSISVK